MNKTEYITGILKIKPATPTQSIADGAGCTTAMVNHVRRSLMNKPIAQPKIVGVIADTHIPFEHPEYLQFCKDTFDRFNVDQVVHIGDLIDHHASSRFQSELCAMNVEEELKMAYKVLKPWIKAFPELKLCLGNHDKIPVRQAKLVGMPQSYMKTFKELYNLPNGWDVAPTHQIDDVHYDHGCGSGGMLGAKNTSLKMGCSYVQGHTHIHSGVYYNSNAQGKTTFGMNVGCGIDKDAYAANYAKDMRGEFTIGCGIVIEGRDGLFIPMK